MLSTAFIDPARRSETCADRHAQGLIHARRAWRLLRYHPRRVAAAEEVLDLLITLCDRAAPDDADHWRHLRYAIGAVAA